VAREDVVGTLYILAHEQNTSVQHAATPDVPTFRELDDARMRATWLGHATFVVQTREFMLLTDPILANFCGPNKWMGYTRQNPAACRIEHLPHIDICTISHDHYDHLCKTTVTQLILSQPQIHWVVPMGLKETLQSWGAHVVTELNWWDKLKYNAHVSMSAVPAQHWSNRGL
jgi:L-ascorbate metabolism protein UlaG (beta-lactamase superfamily)